MRTFPIEERRKSAGVFGLGTFGKGVTELILRHFGNSPFVNEPLIMFSKVAVTIGARMVFCSINGNRPVTSVQVSPRFLSILYAIISSFSVIHLSEKLQFINNVLVWEMDCVGIGSLQMET
jgi:hypothetical protein